MSYTHTDDGRGYRRDLAEDTWTTQNYQLFGDSTLERYIEEGIPHDSKLWGSMSHVDASNQPWYSFYSHYCNLLVKFEQLDRTPADKRALFTAIDYLNKWFPEYKLFAQYDGADKAGIGDPALGSYILDASLTNNTTCMFSMFLDKLAS